MRKDCKVLAGAVVVTASFGVFTFQAVAAEMLVRAEPVAPQQTRQLQQQGQAASGRTLQQQGQSASRLFEELELSAEQRTTCQAVVRNGYEINRELRRQARETWHDLMAALRKPTTTLDEALSKQRELARLQNLLAEKRLETWFAVRKLLTPEQLSRLSSLKSESTLWLEDYGEQRSVKRRNDVP